MRKNERKPEHENGYWVSSPSHSPHSTLAEGFFLLLILFNYPTKLSFFFFLHWAISACVLLPLCELRNLIKLNLREKLIKKLSSSDHHSLSPPHFLKRSNISYYAHTGQKLSPQDKLTLPYNQMAMTANPTTENVPLKRGEITGVETISLLYCRSGGFFLPPPFPLSLLSSTCSFFHS